MGYYLETDSTHGKAQAIADEWGGRVSPAPPSFERLQAAEDVLIVVLNNGMFEAAGICYDEGEYNEFCRKEDSRPKTFVVLSKKKTVEAFAKHNPYMAPRLAKQLGVEIQEASERREAAVVKKSCTADSDERDEHERA
jgi:hypothetical protein